MLKQLRPRSTPNRPAPNSVSDRGSALGRDDPLARLLRMRNLWGRPVPLEDFAGRPICSYLVHITGPDDLPGMLALLWERNERVCRCRSVGLQPMPGPGYDLMPVPAAERPLWPDIEYCPSGQVARVAEVLAQRWGMVPDPAAPLLKAANPRRARSGVLRLMRAMHESVVHKRATETPKPGRWNPQEDGLFLLSWLQQNNSALYEEIVTAMG
jgi:hypothetical protein